ncbi:unnamed protein product [Hermetia illucens]|uniref:Uncharacterized protein n=1 Tax=Hermetia illucens TaxID=343691 RepID=A0A7R8UZB7_HERIL|nr:unnamed protein product [Hermetia illucens]
MVPYKLSGCKDFIRTSCISSILLFFLLVVDTSEEISGDEGIVRSRQKRFIAFPEGSSFSVAICTTIGQIGNPNINFISYALNWGVSYELPNEIWVIQYAHGFKNKIIDDVQPLVQRRSRRSFYAEIEVILDSMGYSGRDCILRALCESKKILSRRKGTMEEELLKAIFSLPLLSKLFNEHRDMFEYERAYHRDHDSTNCARSFSKCGFSLLALALGKHSKSGYNSIYCVVILSIILVIEIAFVGTYDESQEPHSRQKRYLAFPEGSSFSVAICTTIGQIGNPDVDYMSYALNWGVAYDLPNETWVIQHAHGFKNTIIPDDKPKVQRRFRRSLYEQIEMLLDSMGYNGRQCIKRALCESRKFLSERVGTMEVELLKTIFSMPSLQQPSRESRDILEYDHAYQNHGNLQECSLEYPGCGFSLIALALGKHTKPSPNFM